uniref:Uncharacterized protein n=1 Tax=Anguilla anguilla TaxID=7936 RepID=A0A0E9U269_ANGAN
MLLTGALKIPTTDKVGRESCSQRIPGLVYTVAHRFSRHLAILLKCSCLYK